MGGKPRGVLAWHFITEGRKLRYGDGREVIANQTYTAAPEVNGHRFPHNVITLCEYGMHASIKPLDALEYAPGQVICRVRMSGEIVRGDDKLAARNREVLWLADAAETLREFARWCALQVINLWDAPDVVRRYLEAGDEGLRDAADEGLREAAAAAVAADAAGAAARAAARAAAWSAAAGAAARAAARAAAWAAVCAAARAAAAGAARAAAGAARDAQNKQLEKMLMGLRP